MIFVARATITYWPIHHHHLSPSAKPLRWLRYRPPESTPSFTNRLHRHSDWLGRHQHYYYYSSCSIIGNRPWKCTGNCIDFLWYSCFSCGIVVGVIEGHRYYPVSRMTACIDSAITCVWVPYPAQLLFLESCKNGLIVVFGPSRCSCHVRLLSISKVVPSADRQRDEAPFQTWKLLENQVSETETT